MMRLVNHQEAYRIKRLFIKLAHTHSLNHGDDEILSGIADTALDAADGGAWAKVLNTIPPLIREELLVDDDHGSNF